MKKCFPHKVRPSIKLNIELEEDSLRSKLSKVKDKLPSDLNSNVVYRMPCSCYIGQTVRS